MSTIGERIKQIKSHFGIRSNVELAEKADVSKQRVSNWINYNQIPNHEALIALRDSLGVSDAWLLTGKGAMLIDAESSDFINEFKSIQALLSEADKKKILEDARYLASKNAAQTQEAEPSAPQ